MKTFCQKSQLVARLRSSRVGRFLLREDGPTATEYAVMLAFVSMVCLGAIGAVGGTTEAKWRDISTKVSTAFNGG